MQNYFNPNMGFHSPSERVMIFIDGNNLYHSLKHVIGKTNLDQFATGLVGVRTPYPVPRNALDPALMAALRDRLRELVEAGAPALILASSHPRLFCPGWDLKLLAEADRDQVGDFLQEFNALILDLWKKNNLTVVMVTHDLHEGFYLGTRLLVFDKVRNDPQEPNAYGAQITFDIPVGDTREDVLKKIDETIKV